MLAKPSKSREQIVLEVMSKRSELSSEQETTLDRLASGHEGEMYFYQLLKSELVAEPICIFDINLKINRSECQIDCLLIFQNELILLEIKNYQGNYTLTNDDWYTFSKRKIRNPLHQLQRTNLLLQDFLRQHQVPLTIRSFTIFVHPTFFLYQARADMPVIFPTQLNFFIKNLNNNPCQLKKYHHDFATLLRSGHLEESGYEVLPNFDKESLKSGVICTNCETFLLVKSRQVLNCPSCASKTDYEKAILNSIGEFTILFPDEVITVGGIYNWMGGIISKYHIRRILKRHYTMKKKAKYTHYIVRNE